MLAYGEKSWPILNGKISIRELSDEVLRPIKLILSIGLANGANQFLLAIIATLIIVTFLLIRGYYQSKNKSSFQFSADANILNINIIDNNKKNINEITNQLKIQFKYLKLKSANIEKNKSNYVFWYEVENDNTEKFLNIIKEICDENLNVSIYSKSGAYE